ncbi:MAG: T9SS type A sorting domain-containing protein, partial [Bacteroidales bacterium]
LYVAASATPEVLCFGESTDLYAYTSGGAGAYTFTWTSNPAGFESNIQNPTVVPDITTTYHISVFDGQITVNSSITVVVKPVPTAVAGDDQTINMGTNTTLHGLYYGGSGNFSYLWSPADSLANPAVGEHEQNPMTKVMVDTANPTVFTLQILDNNGCNSEPDQMTVFVGGAMLSVFASTTEEVICRGESSSVSAAASGGAGTFSYSWTSRPPGIVSPESELEVTPELTTTYFVNVSDGYFNVIDSVQIVVNQLPQVDLKPANINWYKPDTINVCVRDSIWLDAGPNLTYHWNNGSIDRKIRSITNGQWVDFQTYSVEVTNPATGCKNSDIITIFFDFNTCNLGIDDREDVSNRMKVTPNPTNGVFSLDLTGLPEKGTLYLIDATGKIISEDGLSDVSQSDGTRRFDISHYPQGMYLLYFRSEKYVAVKQLIKN